MSDPQFGHGAKVRLTADTVDATPGNSRVLKAGTEVTVMLAYPLGVGTSGYRVRTADGDEALVDDSELEPAA